MRKGQQKLIFKANREELPDDMVQYIGVSDLDLKRLEIVLRYFMYQTNHSNEGRNSADIISEAERCIHLPQGEISAYIFTRRLMNLLPAFTEDCLFGSAEKDRLMKIPDVRVDPRLVFYHSPWDVAFEAEAALLLHGYPSAEVMHPYNEIKKYPDAIAAVLQALDSRNILKDYDERAGESLFAFYLKYLVNIRNKDVADGLINNFVDAGNRIHEIDRWMGYYSELTNDFSYGQLFEKSFNAPAYYQNQAAKTQIATYLIDSGFLQKDEWGGSYYTECLATIDGDGDNLKRLQDFSTETHIGIQARIHSEFCSIIANKTESVYNEAWDGGYFLKAQLSNAENLAINIHGEAKQEYHSKYIRLSFLITPKNVFLNLGQDSKATYPVQLKKLFNAHTFNQTWNEFIQCCFGRIAESNPFANDVYHDFQNGCRVPLSVNDALSFHSRKDLFSKKYKATAKLKVDWNKMNMNLSWMIIRSSAYVSPGKSMNILQNTRDYTLAEKVIQKNNRYAKDDIKDFLTWLILGRIGYIEESDNLQDNTYQTAKDYVAMCLQTKTKVELTAKTRGGLIKKHNAVMRKLAKVKGKICVPKKSVFTGLREILPPEFEWITSRKRLQAESDIMHHCVASYADSITKDTCAIYSFFDETGKYDMNGDPKRYTIEFQVDGKNGNAYQYKVSQVQGKYDKPNTSKLRAALQEYLQSPCKEKKRKLVQGI